MKLRNRKTESYPLIIHASGSKQAFSQLIFQAFINPDVIPKDIIPDGKIALCYYSTRSDKTPYNLSIEYHGEKSICISTRHEWKTNLLKSVLALEYLYGSGHEYYMFCDAYDTIAIRNPQRALDVLGDRPCILHGNRLQWPPDCQTKPHEGEYPYGGAGGILGQRDALIELFRKALQYDPSPAYSDQYGIRLAAEALGYAVDTKAEIWQDLYGHTHEDIEVAL